MFNNYKSLLLITVFAVVLSVLAGTFGKYMALGLGIWLIQKKDIRYFPLIVMITAFLSTSYILYIQMFFISLANFRFIKTKTLSFIMVLYTIMVLLFVFFSFNKYLSTNTNLGLAMTDYAFVLALAPFFYGLILTKELSDNFDFKKLFNVLIIILLLNILFKLIQFDYIITRLIFYIIPFLFVQICANFNKNNTRKIAIISTFLLLLIVDGLTFTLIFTGLLSWMLLFKKYFSSTRIIFVLLFLTLLIPYYAILNFEKLDYTKYLDMEMKDVQTVDDLQGRLGMKLIEDRAMIWKSAWTSVSDNLKLWPTLEKEILIIQGKTSKEQEWEHHCHNLYLESLLNLGLILGGLTSFLFIYLNIISFKAYKIIQLNNFKLTFIIIAIISNIVGAMSGIFPLLLDFSFYSFGILGIIFGFSKTNLNSINSKIYNFK